MMMKIALILIASLLILMVVLFFAMKKYVACHREKEAQLPSESKESPTNPLPPEIVEWLDLYLISEDVIKKRVMNSPRKGAGRFRNPHELKK